MNIHYGLIIGVPISEAEKGEHPHVYIRLSTQNTSCFKIAINVEDYDHSEVYFAHITDLKAPFIEFIAQLPNGDYPLPVGKSQKGVDYIRGGFVKEEDFSRIDRHSLTEKISQLIKPYITADNGSRLIAYGSRFPHGIHDIHMNQGYPHTPPAPYEDGAIILYDSITNRYNGLFFHFHVQSFKP